MDVAFRMSIFGWYPGLKLSNEHKNAPNKLFVSACFCWDAKLSLSEMEQKCKFCGIIGYWDSYLQFIFCHSEVFRLHVILHDAAGKVRSDTGTGPDSVTCLDEDQIHDCLVT